MAFDWQTLILQAINFAILVWLLNRLFYRPVLAAIDARRTQVADALARAAAAERAAAEKDEALAKARAGLAAEREQLLASAAAAAEESARTSAAEAARRADLLLSDARARLARERDQALAGARAAALDLGIDAARKLLAASPQPSAQAWCDLACRRLADLTPQAKALLIPPGDDPLPVGLASAQPIDGAGHAAWAAALEQLLSRPVVLQVNVQPGLIAGVDLAFPGGDLPLSWGAVLSHLRQELGP